ncbi:MAG: Amino acid adenylation protein [Actinomycetota bacterium]|nr:Amino acid adenylation protein [Actinomycetota bacterium]
MTGPQPQNHVPESVPAQIGWWAAETPEAVAVTYNGRSWTYRQLVTAAGQISALLTDAGVVPRQVIAVIAERGLPLVTAWTAVLDLGAVLLPIDPNTPQPRREEMLNAVDATVVLLGGSAPDPGTRRVITLDNHLDTSAPPKPLGEDHPAADGGYVCFTSGSTGAPKAIIGRHDSLAHFLRWQRRTFAVGAADRVAQLTSVEFDPALRDLFLPLTCGAVLCLPPTGPLAPDEALPWVAREHITLAHVVPTVVRAWLRAAPSGLRLPRLRTVLFAGEPLTGALVERWREQLDYHGQIVNLYGPTETTLARCWYLVSDPVEPGIQPLGMPIDDTQIRIEDPTGCTVEDGTIGEIVIATRYGTNGYLDATAKDAARFTLPPDGLPGEVVYHTGDLGLWEGQQLRFHGRSDDQVKIYGVRVHLRAVESVLEEQPGITQAAVVAQTDDDDAPPRLTAFLVLDSGQVAIPPHLRRTLRRRLPAAAIPARFQVVTTLPTRPISGKLDRRQLTAAIPPPCPEGTL